MANHVRLACNRTIISVPVLNILPVKKLCQGTSRTAKYQRIAASIQEIGIIEPLVVYPQSSGSRTIYPFGWAHTLGDSKGAGAEEGELLGGDG